MFHLILLGDKKDQQISRCLLPLLQKYYKVHYIAYGSLHTFGEGEPVNVIEMAKLQDLTLENSILLLKETVRVAPFRSIDRNTSVILSESNITGFKPLAPLFSNVYTCGLGQKECITFSSREENDLVVSLQRSVLLPQGKVCEPFEIPCHKSTACSDYTVLACVLVLVLTGCLDENKIKEIGKIYIS